MNKDRPQNPNFDPINRPWTPPSAAESAAIRSTNHGWISAISSAIRPGAVVTTPDDMVRYINWLESEVARITAQSLEKDLSLARQNRALRASVQFQTELIPNV